MLVKSMRSPAPTLPNTTGPALMPMPIETAWRLASLASSRCADIAVPISSPARQAWSSFFGPSNMAMTSSPTNLSMSPPFARMMSTWIRR